MQIAHEKRKRTGAQLQIQGRTLTPPPSSKKKQMCVTTTITLHIFQHRHTL